MFFGNLCEQFLPGEHLINSNLTYIRGQHWCLVQKSLSACPKSPNIAFLEQVVCVNEVSVYVKGCGMPSQAINTISTFNPGWVPPLPLWTHTQEGSFGLEVIFVRKNIIKHKHRFISLSYTMEEGYNLSKQSSHFQNYLKVNLYGHVVTLGQTGRTCCLKNLFCDGWNWN